VEEIQEWVNLSDYYLECCGYMYDEGEDLHRGMKIPRCPDCGTNNPKGSEKGDYIWQEINTAVEQFRGQLNQGEIPNQAGGPGGILVPGRRR